MVRSEAYRWAIYVHALVSGRAPALVQRVVLAAWQTSLGHRRIAARAGTVRNVASAGTGARPRLRNGHERRLSRAPWLERGGCRLRGPRDREGAPPSEG